MIALGHLAPTRLLTVLDGHQLRRKKGSPAEKPFGPAPKVTRLGRCNGAGEPCGALAEQSAIRSLWQVTITLLRHGPLVCRRALGEPECLATARQGLTLPLVNTGCLTSPHSQARPEHTTSRWGSTTPTG